MYLESTEISKNNSNDDYYLIEKSENLQQILNETTSNKTSAITKKINFIIKQIVRERSKMSYSSAMYSEKITSLEQDYE